MRVQLLRELGRRHLKIKKQVFVAFVSFLLLQLHVREVRSMQVSSSRAYRNVSVLPEVFTTGRLDGGHKVPDKSFLDLDGKEFFVHDFQDRVLLVIFWAPWSIDSVTSLQSFKGLESYLESKDLRDEVALLPISDTDAADIQSLLQARSSYGFEVALYIDRKRELFDYFNVKSVPTVFIVGKDKSVQYRIPGYVRWDSDAVKEKIISIIIAENKRD